jgi:hypothetical protein
MESPVAPITASRQRSGSAARSSSEASRAASTKSASTSPSAFSGSQLAAIAQPVRAPGRPSTARSISSGA